MTLRARTAACIVAAALLSLPSGAGAENLSKSRSSDYYTKKICRIDVPIGSRLGGVKRCRTRAEEDQLRRDTREVMDRVQSSGNPRCKMDQFSTTCGGN